MKKYIQVTQMVNLSLLFTMVVYPRPETLNDLHFVLKLEHPKNCTPSDTE